jgi:hypothetical protein
MWVVTVFAPIGEFIINFIFTSWTGNWGETYSIATIIINPVTLAAVWIAHAFRSLTQ